MKVYMNQILEELGWTDGSRIPVANEENRKIEDQIAERTRRVIALKDELASEDSKWSELIKYEANMESEHKENLRLLYAYKEQLEREEHLRIVATNENSRMEQEISKTTNEINDILKCNERMQNDIAVALKRAEQLKKSVVGDKGALEEWRIALDRSETDIDVVSRFAKQDVTKAKELEIKRVNLQTEYEKTKKALTEVCISASVSERSAEIISRQVATAIEERRHIVSTWASSVENLHQRDKDIKHLKEELETLREHARRRNDKVLEMRHFLDQQLSNNSEADHELSDLNFELGRLREQLRELTNDNKTMESEVTISKAVLQSVAQMLANQRATNKKLYQEEADKQRKFEHLQKLIAELKPKLEESRNTTKSSAERLKELQCMIQKEDRYLVTLEADLQRLQKCLSRDQNAMAALVDEEKLWQMQMKVSRSTVTKLNATITEEQRFLLAAKEQVYNVEFQLNETLAKLELLERDEAAEALNDPEKYAAMEDRLGELNTSVEHKNHRVNLLMAQCNKLNEEMRRLTKNIAENVKAYAYLKDRLMEMEMQVEGGSRETRKLRETCARLRVDEAVARLRVAQARRSVGQLDNRVYSLDKQRLQIENAMAERKLEIGVRRSVLDVQKRALTEDCGKLRGDIKDRDIRISQLMNRYDLFISLLGKDESGNQITATYYKVKFAQEKAELQEQGDELDAEVQRGEQEVAAMEATLKVVDAANKRYEECLNQGTEEDTEELDKIRDAYFKTKEVVDRLRAQLSWQGERVKALRDEIAAIDNQELTYLDQKAELFEQWNALKFELAEQTAKLQRAERLRRKNATKAKQRLNAINRGDMFDVHITELHNNALTDAHAKALKQLGELCFGSNYDQHIQETILNAVTERGLPTPPAPTLKTDKSETKRPSDFTATLSSLRMQQGSFQTVFSDDGLSSSSGTVVSEQPVVNYPSNYAAPGRTAAAGRKLRQLYTERRMAIETSESSTRNNQIDNSGASGGGGVSRGSMSQVSMNVVMLGLDDTPVRDTGSAAPSQSDRSRKSNF